MYSVVLMMALTSGGDAQAFGHHGGCCGGYSSCCGGGYSSCCGGYAYSGYSSCCGGYSSCCGGGYSSCCGGYSCCGGGHHRLFGGHHHGSCCGGGYSSCCGGSYGGYSSCCGGYSGCCGGMMYAPVMAPATTPAVTPEPIPTKPTDKDKPKESMVPAPATIIVSLPADAKLTIDDAATVSTAAVRVFTSPELPVGQDFHYTLKAQYVQDGKPINLSKDVTVRAGEETRVNMVETAGVASR